MLATTTGIYQSANGGATWRRGQLRPARTPADGFSYVGMTNATQGVAVPANAELGEIFVTTDGGLTWQPSLDQG